MTNPTNRDLPPPPTDEELRQREERRAADEERRLARTELRRPFIEQANELTRRITELREQFEQAKTTLRETYREKRRALDMSDVRSWWDELIALKAWKKAELADLREDYEDDRRDLERARGRVASEMKQAEKEAGYR